VTQRLANVEKSHVNVSKRGIVNGPKANIKRELAKQFRREMTPTERLLWQRLRANRLDGLHFRRQQEIDGFIVDFYCHAAGLILELDGSVHLQQADYDALRDRILSTRQLHIHRISNTSIEQDLEAVLAEIRDICRQRITNNA